MAKRRLIILLMSVSLSFCLISYSAIASNKVEKLFRKAERYYNDKEYDKAITISQKIIKNYPDSEKAPQAQFLIGSSYRQRKEYDQAIREFREVISKYPSSEEAPRAYLLIGITYAIQGKYDQAIQEFQKIIDGYPDTKWVGEAQHGIGAAYYHQEKYDKAVKELEKAARDYPTGYGMGSTLYFLGSIYESQGRYEEAIESYQKSINYPHHPWRAMAGRSIRRIEVLTKGSDALASDLYFLGISFEKQGKYDQALKEFQKVIDQYPNTKWAEGAQQQIRKIKSKTRTK